MVKSLLNYQFHQVKQTINTPVLIFIHGLFGDMDNLGVIARAFSEYYNILRIDLRNHGHSFHSEKMNYQLMAEDVIAVIRHLSFIQSDINWSFYGWKNRHENHRTLPRISRKINRN